MTTPRIVKTSEDGTARTAITEGERLKSIQPTQDQLFHKMDIYRHLTCMTGKRKGSKISSYHFHIVKYFEDHDCKY